MVGIKLSSRIGEKGQLVIPKAIRDQFGIHPNTEVYFFVDQGKVILETKSEKGIVAELVNAVKKKKRFGKKVDWDSRYYSQFRD